MRKQISHKALHGLLALAFLIAMVFGAFQFFGKLQATQAAEISITEYPIPTRDGEPYGITAGSDGNLWFADISGNNANTEDKIGRITPSGTITDLKRVVQKHQKPQITQRVYHQVLKDLLTSIQSELAAGRTVQFLGFGTFYLDERIEELEKEEGIPHPHKH